MRKRALRAAAVAVAMMATSCARPDDPTTWKPLASDDPTLEKPWDVASIARRISTIRHLPVKESIAVERIDAAGLSKRYGEQEMDSHVFETDSTWHALGFAPMDVSVGARIRAGYVATTLGLYDRKEKRLFVRRDSVPNDDQRLALVHEIEHALQFQTFDPTLGAGATGDESLAVRAAFEGDADVTTLAYAAAVHHADDHLVAHVLDQIARGANDRDDAKSRAEDAQIPVSKLLREFPYRAGDLLVGGLYRLGGFAAVDGLLEHLPKSTEQVLHPDKYLAGDPPRIVKKPRAPEGYVDVTSGRLGELALGALLAECGPVQPNDAWGWGGDAYSIVTDYAGKLALLLSTVWDDEDAAIRFEARLASRGACLAAKGANELSNVAVLREGDRVAVVEGLAGDTRDPTLRALLELVGHRRAAVPPFGADCRIPPLVVPERMFPRKGRFEEARYVSAPLGLVVPLTSFAGETSESHELALSRRDAVSAAHAHLTVLLTSLTPELARLVVVATAEGVAARGDTSMKYEGDEMVATGLGPARAYVWMHGEYNQHALILASFCDGLGTVALDASFGGRGAWSELVELLEKTTMDEASPACVWLKANKGEPTLPKSCTLPELEATRSSTKLSSVDDTR